MDAAPNVLVVVGTATASVEPETASLSVGLEATADTPGAALGMVTEASEAVLAAVHAHGVPAADIRTHAVSVNHKYNANGQRISGYDATHVLGLRVSPISSAAAVIDAVAQAAGNALQLGGFSVSTHDIAAARTEAAAKAFADARDRAAVLAQAAGVRLGPALSIVEDGAADHTQYPHAVGLGFPARHAAHMPVQAGTDAVTARLTVTFRLGE